MYLIAFAAGYHRLSLCAYFKSCIRLCATVATARIESMYDLSRHPTRVRLLSSSFPMLDHGMLCVGQHDAVDIER